MLRNEVFAYIKEEYDIDPDYPWAKTPNHAVFRHPHSRKWLGLIVEVTEDKLGLCGCKRVDALLLKCDPMMIGSLLTEPGILPGYHMNKEHWITVLLSDVIAKSQVCSLINLSYGLTL